MMRQDPSKLWLPDIGYSLACGLVIAPYITSIAAFTPIKGWFAGSYGLTKKFSAMSDPGWTTGQRHRLDYTSTGLNHQMPA